MEKNQAVRVRIAPSPTGDPHVGLAYMTLFNYVFAKKYGGKLILRIEDTDQVRAKASSLEMICASLNWLGLQWDEGPDIGGDYGPYLQSERKQIHIEHAEKLIASGNAYCCFCTPQRLAELREYQKANKINTGYDRKCRELSVVEANKLRASGNQYVIRLKMPLTGKTIVSDAIRGDVEFDNTQIDDQVLIKSDGFPTYHLANVVDDHLMKISHVMRAEEWISSTPKHVVLYEAFGWQKPVFAHFPLLRNVNRSKISKRKNPVSLNYYRRKGILPAAMLNFLALMGWSFGNDVEIFTIEQMIEKFELRGVHLGGPVFDLEKLAWLNQQYMHRMSGEQFADHLLGEVFTREYLMKLQPLALERMSTFEQFVDNNSFFFNGALNYTGVSILPKGKDVSEMRKMVEGLLELLDELYVWTAPDIQKTMDGHRESIGWKPKDYYMSIRLIASGRKDSPPLAESMELIGREMVRFRMRDCLTNSELAQK
jgi:glutamyl-tRNA synthetase